MYKPAADIGRGKAQIEDNDEKCDEIAIVQFFVNSKVSAKIPYCLRKMCNLRFDRISHNFLEHEQPRRFSIFFSVLVSFRNRYYIGTLCRI